MSDQPTQLWREVRDNERNNGLPMNAVPLFHKPTGEPLWMVPAEPCEHGNYASHPTPGDNQMWLTCDGTPKPLSKGVPE